MALPGVDITQEFQTVTASGFAAGMQRAKPAESLADGECVTLRGMRPYRGYVRTDTGLVTWGSVVRGTPLALHRFQLKDGTEKLLLFTTVTAYVWNTTSTDWDYISNGTYTQVDGAEAAGQTTITVDSSTGFVAGEFVGIVETDGSMHLTTLGTTPDGTHVLLVDALPTGAADNAWVVQATVLTGSTSKPMIAETWTPNDAVLFTNDVEEPQEYNPATGPGVIADLGGTATAEGPLSPGTDSDIAAVGTLAVVNNQVFLADEYVDDGAGAVERPQRVRFSEVADRTNWNTGNASYQDLWDTDDPIHGVIKLADAVVLVREESVGRYEYVGSTTQLWRDRAMVAGIGCIGKRAWCVARGAVYFISEDGVYEYRGDFAAKRISEAIDPYLFGVDGVLAAQYRSRAWITYLAATNELLLMVPAAGSVSPNVMFRYNLTTKAWWRRDFPLGFYGFGFWRAPTGVTWGTAAGTWGDATGSWDATIYGVNAPMLMLAGDDGQVYAYDFAATDDDGTAINWVVETGDVWRTNGSVLVDGLEFLYRGGAVTVEYSVDHGLTWAVYGTVTGTAYLDRVTIAKQITSRQIRFRFSGSGAAELGWWSRKEKTSAVF